MKKNDILVCCHIYYFNIWKDDIEKRLKEFGNSVPFDLFVSITNNVDRTKDIEDIKANFPGAEVRLIENLGEDARGFASCVRWLKESGNEYKSILKIHTKSEDWWRKDLLNALIKTDEGFLENLLNEECGFCISEKYYRCSSNPRQWDFNGQYLDDLRKMCGCEYRTTNHFSGTMFWISYDVVKRYFMDAENFVEEYFDQPYASGYTKQHSFELFIGCVAHDCGKKVLSMEDNHLLLFRQPSIDELPLMERMKAYNIKM